MVKKNLEISVYVIPPQFWCQKLHCIPNQAILDTLFAGKISVSNDLQVFHLRRKIQTQLRDSPIIPNKFVFVRSVGRCLTQVRWVQERLFRANIFTPPQAYQPDLFLLDADYADRSAITKTGSLPDIKIVVEEYDSDREKREAQDNRSLSELIEERKRKERHRQKLIKKMLRLLAKSKGHQIQNSDKWKKLYYEQKRQTPHLEEQYLSFRRELDSLHRTVVTHMRHRVKEAEFIPDLESDMDEAQHSYEQMHRVAGATKCRYDIEEIQRLVDEAKEKLTAEIQMRTQQDQERRYYAAGMTDRSIRLTVMRGNRLGTMGNDKKLVSAARKPLADRSNSRDLTSSYY